MLLKKCTKCGEEKDVSNFYSDPRGKHGVSGTCKACRSAYFALRYAENKEKIIGINNAWRERNKEQLNAARRAWAAKNKDKTKEYFSKWRAKNASIEIARSRDWQEKNREEARRLSNEWKARNPQYNSTSRAKKLSATPSWANLERIREIYKEAKRQELLTGKKCHVDHIVPLNSPIVCGLHVENNLQILFASDNLRKGNRHAA